MRVIALTIFCVLGIAGCAGRYYRDVPETAPYAILTMHQPRSFKGTTFLAFDNYECNRTDGMGLMRVFSWATAEAKSNRFQPDKRVYILASSLVPTGVSGAGASGSVVIAQATCDNLVSFVPIAGHEYAATHEFDGATCLVHLIDTSTNQAPATLQLHAVPKGCGS